jgi:hypothetical protein
MRRQAGENFVRPSCRGPRSIPWSVEHLRTDAALGGDWCSRCPIRARRLYWRRPQVIEADYLGVTANAAYTQCVPCN